MTLNCLTRGTIFLGVNLTVYQGVNAHEHWVSGRFSEKGAYRVQKRSKK